MTRAWIVRAGAYGENESLALDQNVVVVGWSELGDLSAARTRDELAAMLREAYPEDGVQRLRNFQGQLWAFRDTIAVGDLVVLPLKTRSALAIGKVAGPYQYRSELPPTARHTRPVTWLTTDLPRTAVRQDLLYTLGAFLTVCEIKRNEGAERIRALAETGRDPGARASASRKPAERDVADMDVPSDETHAPKSDISRVAADEITAYISEHFAGHGLARLVEAVFIARGMATWRAPEGPDGGIDVLVGSGPLGMDQPRICVQVKSAQSPMDVGVVRELQGVVTRLGGDQGLLVAWGGLTRAAEKEIRQQFFQVRVWTADDLVREVTAAYDRLPDEIQAELPLKRVWALSADEAG
jgi:restriction system protein